MKFEKPIINITMFEAESVATQASMPVSGTSNYQAAQDAASAAAGSVGAADAGAAVSLAF